jgi:hypothetical protein
MRSTAAQVPEAGQLHPVITSQPASFKRSTKKRRPRSRPARPWRIRPALICLLARDRVAAELVRHTVGRGRGPLEEVEGLAVLVQRPIAPADITRADKAQPVAAEMAPGPCPRRGVRDLPERREALGVVAGRPYLRASNPTMRGLGAVTAAAPSPPARCGRVPKDSKPVHQLATNALSCQVSGPGLAAEPAERVKSRRRRGVEKSLRRWQRVDHRGVVVEQLMVSARMMIATPPATAAPPVIAI